METKNSSPALNKSMIGKKNTWFFIGLFLLAVSFSLSTSGKNSTGLISVAHADQSETQLLSNSQTTNDTKRWTWLWYTHRIIAIFAGLFCTYLGYKLFVLGVNGQASLIVENKTTKAQLINASPGIFFALFGMALIAFVVWTT